MYSVSKYLGGLLKPHTGKTEAHVKNSAALVAFLDELILAPIDSPESLDVVSLYTVVPLQHTLDWLQPLFSEPILYLFQRVLTSTDGQCLSRTKG